MVLTALFLALVLTGAGQMPGFLPFAVLVLLVALATRRPRNRRLFPHASLFWATIAPIVLCVATLLPLPEAIVGQKRASYFNRSQAVSEALAGLGVDLLAGNRWTVADITATRNAVNKGLAFWSSVAGSSEGVGEALGEADGSGPARPLTPRPRTVHKALTLNRAGTIRTLFLLSGVWACFWLVATADGQARGRLLLCLVAIGGVVAVVGMAGRLLFPQGKTLLWLLEVPHGRPMGPFVNRNHFALFCGMLLPAALLLATRGVGGNRSTARAGTYAAMGLRRIFCLICALVLSAAVAVSLSRSGLLVLAAAVATTVATVFRRRLVWGGVMALLAAGLLAGIWHFPLAEFQDRLSTLHDPFETDSAQTRLQVWRDGLSVWRDFPVAGAGADAFRTVYPTRKTSPSRKGALHAENEYVQLVADHGVVGVLLLVAFGWVYVARVFFSSPSHPRHARPVDGGSGTIDDVDISGYKDVALATLAAVAVHAFFDFGLRMPLNAFVLAAVMGCAVPPAKQPGEMSKASDSRRRVPTLAKLGNLRAWALAGLLLLLPASNLYWLAAWNLDNYVVLEDSALPLLAKSTAWAPSYWHPWHEMGRRCLDIAGAMGPADDPRRAAFSEIGRYCIWSAAFLNSFDYRMWISAARVAHDLGDSAAAAQAAARVVELRPHLARSMRVYLDDQ